MTVEGLIKNSLIEKYGILAYEADLIIDDLKKDEQLAKSLNHEDVWGKDTLNFPIQFLAVIRLSAEFQAEDYLKGQVEAAKKGMALSKQFLDNKDFLNNSFKNFNPDKYEFLNFNEKMTPLFPDNYIKKIPFSYPVISEELLAKFKKTLDEVIQKTKNLKVEQV